MTTENLDAQLDALTDEWFELKNFLRGAPVGFYANEERRMDAVAAEHNKLLDDNGLAGWVARL